MAKFEHVFKVRASVGTDGQVILKLEDEDEVIARNVTLGGGMKVSRYEFELGSAEFEEHEKNLKHERKILKGLLQRKFDTVKTKVRV